jgi:hypothetical protein
MSLTRILINFISIQSDNLKLESGVNISVLSSGGRRFLLPLVPNKPGAEKFSSN